MAASRKVRKPDDDHIEELLEKLLVIQLFVIGASQDRIARIVGRQKAWVNEILKGIRREK